MGTIVVKDLPNDVYAALRRLAAEREQSFDEFVRNTLREIVSPHLRSGNRSLKTAKLKTPGNKK
jgi:plasmid stability protein